MGGHSPSFRPCSVNYFLLLAACASWCCCLADITESVKIAPDGPSFERGSAADAGGSDIASLLEILDKEVAATKQTLTAAQAHVEELIRLREKVALSPGSHALSESLPSHALSAALEHRAKPAVWPRSSFRQYLLERQHHTSVSSSSVLVGLHWFPLRRTHGWAKPAAGSHAYYTQPEAVLVRVWNDGAVQLSSGSADASFIMAVGTGAGTYITSSSALLTDAPAIVVATSDNRILVWNFAVFARGTAIVGRPRVDAGRSSASSLTRPGSNPDPSIVEPLPLHGEAECGCEFVLQEEALAQQPSGAGMERITALQSTSLTLADSTAYILVGTSSGRVLSLHRNCTMRRVGGITYMAPPPRQKGVLGTGTDAATAVTAITPVVSNAGPTVAIGVGGNVVSLNIVRPDKGPVVCEVAPGGQGYDKQKHDIVSLVHDVTATGVLWAATAGGDVLVLSPRYNSGTEGCKTLARLPHIDSLIFDAAGVEGSPAQLSSTLSLASIRGYTFVVSHAGCVIFNGTGLPMIGPRIAMLQSRALGEADKRADALGAFVRSVSVQALIATVPAVARAAGHSAYGTRDSGASGVLSSQHKIALVAGMSLYTPRAGEAVLAPSASTLTVFDCLLPFKHLDLFDDLHGRGGGGALGWIRGPLFFIAIGIAVYVGRSRAGVGGEGVDDTGSGLSAIGSAFYGFVTGTDGSTGRKALGRDSRSEREEKGHYERLVRQMVQDGYADPALARSMGVGMGPMRGRPEDSPFSGGGLEFGQRTGGHCKEEEDEDAEAQRLVGLLRAAGQRSSLGASGRGGGRGPAYVPHAAEEPDSSESDEDHMRTAQAFAGERAEQETDPGLAAMPGADDDEDFDGI